MRPAPWISTTLSPGQARGSCVTHAQDTGSLGEGDGLIRDWIGNPDVLNTGY
jgi:hypothetical protein